MKKTSLKKGELIKCLNDIQNAKERKSLEVAESHIQTIDLNVKIAVNSGINYSITRIDCDLMDVDVKLLKNELLRIYSDFSCSFSNTTVPFKGTYLDFRVNIK